MPDHPDRIAALDRQAAQEPSLARAQMIAQNADRLRSRSRQDALQPRLSLHLFRN